MHSLLPFLLAMIAAIVLLEMLATKLKIAYPIVLVVAGLLISFIPGLPVVKINPDLIFFIFLSPLLFSAAWSISFKEMKRWWRMIGSFAFLVVFFTAFSVAIVTSHFIPGFTLALGFLLGGIVSPPDAVSTGAITRFVKIPKSTAAVLEGESLLNDASSLMIFRFALIAISTGQFIWVDASLSFMWMIIGGTGIGLALAIIFIKAHKYLPTDAPSDIALTLIEPYFMYWVAEQLHSSGVLAVVAGGLLMSSRSLVFLNSTSRVSGYSVWESLEFILNGIVFLIIGLELPEIVQGLKADGIETSTAIKYGILVTAVLIVARILSSYMALIATLIFRPKVVPGIQASRRRFWMPLLLGWTGMRGVVSLAAALAIPVTLNGSDFPHRNLILFITFTVILLTLLVQGLTLPYFINRFRLFDTFNDEAGDAETRLQIKKGLRAHTYTFLRNKYENELHDHAGMQKLLKHWEEKTKASEEEDWMNPQTRSVYKEMLEAQRSYLIELNKDPAINEEIIRIYFYQIDLEEERLNVL